MVGKEKNVLIDRSRSAASRALGYFLFITVKISRNVFYVARPESHLMHNSSLFHHYPARIQRPTRSRVKFTYTVSDSRAIQRLQCDRSLRIHLLQDIRIHTTFLMRNVGSIRTLEELYRQGHSTCHCSALCGAKLRYSFLDEGLALSQPRLRTSPAATLIAVAC